MKDENIVYEYKSINVKTELEPIYTDCYEHFGWIRIKENERKDYYINNNVYQDVVNIRFKRNSQIENKAELKIYQDECEKSFLKINRLEKEPSSLAIIYALIIGLIGILFLVVAIFAILGNKWFIGAISIIMGCIGFILPYFVYRRTKGSKEKENKTKIEEEQEKILKMFKQSKKILEKNELC